MILLLPSSPPEPFSDSIKTASLSLCRVLAVSVAVKDRVNACRRQVYYLRQINKEARDIQKLISSNGESTL